MKRWRTDTIGLWVTCASLLLLQSVAFAQNDETAPSASREPYQPLRTFQNSATAIDAADSDPSKQAVTTVAVIGAVESPGSFSFTGNRHYLDLIAAAGGPSADAQRGVKIVRRGQVLMPIYDPATTTAADAEEFGHLQDGDVIVVRPKTGVRSAFHETDRSVDAQGRSPQGGRPAQTERVPVVACVGLTSYPCAFSIDPQRSVLRLFLMEGFGLPEAVVAQVKLIPAAGAVPRDGLLTDGCTLIFPDGLVQSGQLSPDLVFPAPKPIKPTPREVVQPGTSVRIPGVPFLARESSADHPSGTSSLLPGTSTHNRGNADTVAPHQTSRENLADAAPASRLPLNTADWPSSNAIEPFPPSGLFELSTDAPTPSSDSPKSALPRVHRGVITAAAVQGPSDVTGPTLVDAPNSSSSPPTQQAGTSPHNHRSIPNGETLETAELVGDTASEFPVATESSVGLLSILASDIFLGVAGLLSILCLIGAQVWGQYQRRELAARDAARSQQQQPSIPIVSREPTTPLELLIANRYPVIEEQVRIALLPRYQGRSIGGKRLIINEAHPPVPAPHAAFTRESGPNRRKSETVSVGSYRPERTQQAAPSVTPTHNGPRTHELNTGTVSAAGENYDVVYPAGSPGTERAPRPPDGGLLERVLLAAQREKKS